MPDLKQLSGQDNSFLEIEKLGLPEGKVNQRVHDGHCTYLIPEERRFVNANTIRAAGGLVGEPDEIIHELRIREEAGLREIAQVHRGEFRLTPNQNIIVANVDAADVDRIEVLARDHGLLPAPTPSPRTRAGRKRGGWDTIDGCAKRRATTRLLHARVRHPYGRRHRCCDHSDGLQRRYCTAQHSARWSRP